MTTLTIAPLQVRQNVTRKIGVLTEVVKGVWVDVPSPSWLLGYIIPSHPDEPAVFSYEFRYRKEDNEQNR